MFTNETAEIRRPDVMHASSEMLANIEMLDDAISKNVKARFTYLRYDLNQNLIARRDKKYTVNPYGLVHTNGHYYLVCRMAYQENVSMYRIDRIANIELTDCDLDDCGQVPDRQTIIQNALTAFSGEPQAIEFRCGRQVLAHAIEKFGSGIRITEADNDRLEINLTATPKEVKYWALQFLPYVEVTSPGWLRNEIIESISHNPYFKTGGR